MATFSRNRKLIEELLTNAGDMTAEEIKDTLELDYTILMKELATMIKDKIIDKRGFPTIYSIKKQPIKEKKVDKMPEENQEKNSFPLELNVIVEFSVIEINLLKKQIKDYEEMLRKEEIFKIKNLEVAEIEEDQGRFNTFMEINLEVQDFAALIRLIFYYGPISVEVIKPKEYTLSMAELQDGLIDMAKNVHAYVENITRLMSEKELENFNKQFYK